MYVVDGIVYYVVVNILGVVFYIFILVLINVILFYVIVLVNKGWRKVCKEDLVLVLGLNVVEGKVVY